MRAYMRLICPEEVYNSLSSTFQVNVEVYLESQESGLIYNLHIILQSFRWKLAKWANCIVIADLFLQFLIK